MSSLLNIPKRILAKLYELEKKIVTFPFADKIRRKRLRIGDILENRELIVVDKYGNHYYQYYSYQGLPTKRMVHFLVKKVHLNMYAFNKWHDEPLMLSWLQMRELIAPSQEDLERRYVDQENFERNALEWDKKEKLQIDEYKRRREFSLGRDRKETGAKGIGEEYSPGIWDKKQLVQVKSEEKQLEEASKATNHLGRYVTDLNAEDEKKMAIWEQKMLEPYLEVYKQVDWDEYTFEKMNERYRRECELKAEEFKIKKKELLNIDRKLIEKREEFKKYADFRERFNDVFKELDFDDKSSSKNNH